MKTDLVNCTSCSHNINPNSILWRPSIFIPHACSRINLSVTNTRIERLYDLDDTEARLEGFKDREDFLSHWNKLNKKRGFPREANPWVYRIEFERIKDDN